MPKSEPTIISYAERRARCRAFYTKTSGTGTPAGLARLAASYEAAYARSRTSKRPPQRAYLLGMLQTARVFYSLAREVARAAR